MATDNIALCGGKVFKSSLPIINGRPLPDAPRLKRLMLAQGELAHFWDGEEPIHYLAFVELRAGALRGNHYHLAKREIIYIIAGQVLLALKDTQSPDCDSVTLRTGDLTIIPTGIAHALQTLTPGQAIEFSNARFNPDDVFPFKLLPNSSTAV